MRALVACEESQRVTIELRKRGWEAYSCDIQEPSGGHPEWHIKGDVTPIINGYHVPVDMFITLDGKAHCVPKRWDLIIAHPPCTYLSNAGACRLYPKAGQLNQERYQKGLEAKDFFMRLYNANCDHVCVENPLPSRVFKMPKCAQVIQPYEFGHPYSKRTLLWLRGLPQLRPTQIVEEHTPWLPSNTGGYSRGGGGSRGAIRGSKNYAKTFPGIAAAMAEQWTQYIENGDDQIRMVSV